MTQRGTVPSLQYLNALIDQLLERGVRIYEQTTAVDVKEGNRPAVITKDDHHLTGRYIISCSHFPFMMGKDFISRVFTQSNLCGSSQNNEAALRWNVLRNRPTCSFFKNGRMGW
ncbi:NAD(P)/FAD-dependent oxidoreductase [Bacillus sp. SL00103]